VVETWPEAQRGRVAAFVLSSFPAGGVLAALTAGLILPNWRLLFLVAGIGAAIPLVVVGLLFPVRALTVGQQPWRGCRAGTTGSPESGSSLDRSVPALVAPPARLGRIVPPSRRERTVQRSAGRPDATVERPVLVEDVFDPSRVVRGEPDEIECEDHRVVGISPVE
jgi:MFS family permease